VDSLALSDAADGPFSASSIIEVRAVGGEIGIVGPHPITLIIWIAVHGINWPDVSGARGIVVVQQAFFVAVGGASGNEEKADGRD
jgi:hypothetical protein